MTTHRRRADLDDEPESAWVKEPPKPVSLCCRCSRELPAGKTLWTLCEYCDGGDVKAGPALPRHPDGTQGLIGELAKQLVASLPNLSAQGAVLSDAIVTHMERLKRRGLSDHMALRQAEALVADAAHRAGCAICGQGE